MSYTVCPLSVSTSQCTVCCFCVTMSTAVFYSLSNVCQYLTMYSLLFLYHYVRCCLLHSVHCLSVPHNVQSVGSVSLCQLLSSIVCPHFVITFTRYIRLVLCHFVQCYFLYSAHDVSLPHIVQTIGFVTLCSLLHSTVCLVSVNTSNCNILCCSASMCPLPPSTACPLFISTSMCTICWFCVTMPNAVVYSLSALGQYLTIYTLSTLCQYLTI